MRRTSVAAALVAVGLSASGCAAITFPAGPSAEDERLVAAAGTNGRCVVTGGKDAGDRDAFAAGLRSSGLFESVDAVESDPRILEPDWIVTMGPQPDVEPANRTCLGGPDAVAIFTLGIIPVVRTRDAKRTFEVRAARPPFPGWRFRPGGEVTGIDGWVSFPLHLMSWWFASSEASSRRRLEARLLAVELVKSGLLADPEAFAPPAPKK